MPKKKQPRNAFYFFMKDYKEDQEQMGVYFRGGMKEVAEAAGPLWKELPLDQRAPYEQLAAEHKLKEKRNLDNKFTTTGISYAQLEKQEFEGRQLELKIMREITGTVQGLDRDTTLKTHNFYFVHFNYYCPIDDGSYLVCEVAIAQFCLQDGVKDVFHTLIKQDKIPTGYCYQAKLTSEETHQIPLPDDLQEGERYHGNLFLLIKSFVEQHKSSSGGLPPLYAFDKNMEVAQNALTLLAEYHYPQNPDLFKVYPLEKLFFYLRNAASPPGNPAFPVESLASRELEKDQYNFAPGIACGMHDKTDNCVYCSKSIVQRWAFLICDHCCMDLKIRVMPGKHVPINAVVPEVVNDQPDDSFNLVTKRGHRATAAPARADALPQSARSAGRRSQAKPEPPCSPLRVQAVDLGKAGPPEDSAHYFNINPAAVPATVSSPISKSGGNCWGVKSGEGPLRRPIEYPQSVRDALNFTEDDFPDLGRNHFKTPAAVAGRGSKARARIMHEEVKPGGLSMEPESSKVDGAGRGRGRAALFGKSVPRLAANLQELQLD